MAESIRILSCDGGGIRGLVTTLMIEDLDKNFGVIAKAQVFAGTSTGGLIALALANGVKLAKIIDIYENQGETIFQKNGGWGAEQVEALQLGDEAPPEALEQGPGYLRCAYKSDGLEKVGRELLGDLQLGTLKGRVVVNSAQLWTGKSWEGRVFSNLSSGPFNQVKLIDVALATSAAPTYFPPHKIDGFGYFADGGTFANNPSLTALSEVLGASEEARLGDLRVLSLGTGSAPLGIPPEAVGNPLDWGITHWFWPTSSKGVPATALLTMTLDLTARVAATEAAKILGDGFIRADVTLPKPYPLDDWKDVSQLREATEKYLKTSDWENVKRRVGESWG